MPNKKHKPPRGDSDIKETILDATKNGYPLIAVYVNTTCDSKWNCYSFEMFGTILGAYNILDKFGYEMDTVLLFSSPEGADPVDFYGLSW